MTKRVDLTNLITITEAAGILCVSRPTIYAMVRRNQLNIYKMGRNSYLNRTEVDSIKSQGKG